MLSKEEIENIELKVSVPIITDEEIRQIDNNFDNAIEQFTKQIIHNKDLAMAQYIIQKQQDKIDQIETDKQKIIEKLEKDIKYYECDLLRIKQIGIDENDEQVITDKILIDKYKEILSILKGENHE